MVKAVSKRIIVGLSGGVDSAVAAWLLKQQGYEVHGLFMKNWEADDTETYCSAAADLKDAQQISEKLDIPLHRVNFAAEYWQQVFNRLLAATANTHTLPPFLRRYRARSRLYAGIRWF